jgi:type IV secretion system protein VirB3
MSDLQLQTRRDPVFKGCTRPAMVMGVPLVPLVVVCGGGALGAMWGMLISGMLAVVSIAVGIALIILMREITHRDDHRLGQWQLRMTMRLGNRTSRFWGATSYSACRYKRR